MDEINYVPYLPKEPPEGLTRWLLAKGELSKEHLIYRSDWEYEPLEDRSVRVVRVSCTACGRQFVARRADAGGCHNAYAPAPFGWVNETIEIAPVIDGDETICPICGAEARTIHIGRFGRAREISVGETWTAVVSRLEVPGKTPRLLLTDWLTRRMINRDGGSRFDHHLYTAWVVEERKIVRIMGHSKMFSAVTLRLPEQRKTFLDNFGAARHVWPADPAVLEGTTAENCKLDRYVADGGLRLVGYLGLWRKRPQAENLVTMGLTRLLDGLIEQDTEASSYERSRGYATCKSVNWREVSPSKMLGLNREQLASFVRRNWGTAEYGTIRWASEVGTRIPEPWTENVELLTKMLWQAKQAVKAGHGAELWRIMRYLDRQNEGYDMLRDYWETAGRLGMELEDSQVRWPKNLGSAHGRAVERYNQRLDEAADEMMHSRAEALAWLSWERDGLLIRPCASRGELRREGRLLHHCVATYDKRYAEGKTAILFIRRTDAPDEPYYTLELDEEHLTVRQNRGLRNCARTDEVQDFETAWLEWARRGKKKNKKEANVA